MGLTGSKLGCGEGGCGACTVMLSKLAEDKVHHFAVNACLTPLCAMHGLAVTTVEGIGSTKTTLHPCQVSVPSSLDLTELLMFTGENSKGSWISVWVLYSWFCHVYVLSSSQ